MSAKTRLKRLEQQAPGLNGIRPCAEWWEPAVTTFLEVLSDDGWHKGEALYSRLEGLLTRQEMTGGLVPWSLSGEWITRRGTAHNGLPEEIRLKQITG